MSSLIPGYEYDIFISYRQKDNKYDGWVTEFVANLRKELEATFKDDVSIYFDENPHDGLLETHSVGKSLEGKLKSLILIPIISQTYCDPKSFAWQHEFMAFNQIASSDKFGRTVRLANGNMAERILPVRIHDIDPEDIQLYESATDEVLRSVDFIYRLPGVNRQLRAKDDEQIKNPNQILYRDQINKVAHAIKDLINGLKKLERNDLSQPEIRKIPAAVSPPSKEIPKVKEIQNGLHVWGKRVVIWALPMAALCLGAFFFVPKWRDRKRAETELLPVIQKLADDNFRPPTTAYDLALEAEKIIPGDSSLKTLLPIVITTTSIITEPPGAEVFWKDYDKPESTWRSAGVTPIKDGRFPRPYLRMEIRKEGHQTIEYAGPWHYGRLGPDIDTLTLDPVGSLPENMVRIPTKVVSMYIIGLAQHGGKKIHEFLMDRVEVSNKQFKTFMDAGGYSNKTYWKHPFYLDGKEISFEAAVKLFTDKTGRQAPANWEGGMYPDGQEGHPVTGVSWYEAAAYASFVEKKLPTVFHWGAVAETSRTEFIIPWSNFSGKSSVAVGSLPGYSTFGIYDLAGNAREWCSNESSESGTGLRFILGGGYNDATYSFNDSYTQQSFDRGLANGFRCMKELSGDTSYNQLANTVKMQFRDYKKEKPVDDKTFDLIRRQYAYDKTPLQDSIEYTIDKEFWTVEKITFDAAYGNERMQAYLYLPKNAKPPFQPIVFFPGSGDIYSTKFDPELITGRLDFLVKNGRAIVYPILKGTHERHGELNSDIANETVFYKDHVIMWRKDIGRIVDYLETRKDIQSDKVGYLGWSWGGLLGGIMNATETRIKAVVLNVGGLDMEKALPEADPLNFLPRVLQPVLMLNGKHDMFFPLETSQKPMFEFLGTPKKDKKIIIYESGHLVPRTEFVKETLIWYDKYLGPAGQ